MYIYICTYIHIYTYKFIHSFNDEGADYIEKQLEKRLKDTEDLLSAQTTNSSTDIVRSHYFEVGLGKWGLRALGALCRYTMMMMMFTYDNYSIEKGFI
jgi:hypothetical protein